MPVELIAAVHIADSVYYKRMEKLFAGYDSLLYELVKPKGKKPRSRIKAVGGGQAKRPGRASLLSRGLSRVEEDDRGPLVQMQTDASGVAITVFRFLHVGKK